MLDLRILRRKLTQGQPPAAMILPLQRARPMTAPQGQQGETSASAAPATELVPPVGFIDPEELARRVYDLMRQELAVERERRGWRGA